MSLPSAIVHRRTLLGSGLGTATLGAVGLSTGCQPVTPTSGSSAENTFTIYWNPGHVCKAYQTQPGVLPTCMRFSECRDRVSCP